MTEKWSQGAGKLTRGAKSTEDRSMRLTMYPGSSSAERPRFERCSRSISQGIPGCFEGDKFFRSRIMTLQESIHISRVVRGCFANRLVLEATGFLFHFSNTLKCLRGNKASIDFWNVSTGAALKHIVNFVKKGATIWKNNALKAFYCCFQFMIRIICGKRLTLSVYHVLISGVLVQKMAHLRLCRAQVCTGIIHD